MTYKNIVVSGDVGTGTTTLAKGLAQKLGWRYLSVGELFRQHVLKKDLPLISELPENWDFQIEKEMKERMEKESGIVFEGHYQGWNARDLKDVFKILLVCDQEVAAERVADRTHTHAETQEEAKQRSLKHREVFKKRYGEDDHLDKKFFDLVIDTSKKSIPETLETALEVFNEEKAR